MLIVSSFSERFREILDIRNIKPSKFSEMVDINKSTISQYLNGEYEPKRNRIELFAKILNVNEAWLMGYDVSMERTNNLSRDSTLHMYRIDTRGLNKEDIAEFEKELNEYAEFIKAKILKKKEKQ